MVLERGTTLVLDGICLYQWRIHGRPRITVTSARTATASLVERRGEGVDRRAARQEPLAGAVAGRSRNDGSSPSAN